MLVRTSLALLTGLALTASACSRATDPNPDQKAADKLAAAPSAELKPAIAPEPTGPVYVPPLSRHDSDMSDVAMAHPPNDNPSRIKASHILIAYKGAKDAAPKVTRSREDAKTLADHVGMQARAGTDFSELALKYSDDPNVKFNKGNLGELTRKSMVKPFTDAAFGLLKQEIRLDPLETEFGFHIIKRTE